MPFNIPDNIQIYDVNSNPAAFLNPSADGLKGARVDARLNGESILEFFLPPSSDKLSEITPECRIYPGNNREYIILKDEAIDFVRDEKNTLWARVMAVESFFELNYEFATVRNDSPDPPSHLHTVTIVSGGSDLSGGLYAVGTAAHALYGVLSNVDWAGKTPWTVGVVDVTGIHDLETEKLNVLENINKIQELWGGYLVWDSINKTVSLRDENTWQNYNEFGIRYKKNEKGMTRTQSNRIITRLYVYGADDLNISDVNDGKEYLEDYSYTSRRYSAIIPNPDIYESAQLKTWGLKELAKICKPRYSYLAKIIDLRTLPEYNHETFTFGDMADVFDADIGASDRLRIIRHAYDVFQPWKCEIELGEPVLRLADMIANNNYTTNYISSYVAATQRLSGTKITGSLANVSITDSIFKTATSGNRIEIDSSGLIGKDSSNAKEGISIEEGTWGFSDINIYKDGAVVGRIKFNANNELELYAGDIRINCSKLGIFNGNPVAKTDVTNPEALVTIETADATYDTTEQDMLNHLKTDVTNIRARMQELITALRALGIC